MAENTPRVLIVDDSEQSQVFLSAIFSKLGANTCTASSGQEALDILTSSQDGGDPFHLMLVDIRMPGMSGIELGREVRAKGYKGKIVAMTATPSVSNKKEAESCGIDAYIGKTTINPNVLSAFLESVRP